MSWAPRSWPRIAITLWSRNAWCTAAQALLSMVRRSTPRTSAPSEPAIGVTVMLLIRNSSNAEAIESRGGAAEQVRLLARAGALRQTFAGVPIDAVAVRALVDREVAFEHRPVGTEG